jgi:hypothetical protein
VPPARSLAQPRPAADPCRPAGGGRQLVPAASQAAVPSRRRTATPPNRYCPLESLVSSSSNRSPTRTKTGAPPRKAPDPAMAPPDLEVVPPTAAKRGSRRRAPPPGPNGRARPSQRMRNGEKATSPPSSRSRGLPSASSGGGAAGVRRLAAARVFLAARRPRKGDERPRSTGGPP